MPRKPRFFIPGQPQHIVVRGHSREPIMTRLDDFRFMYQCLLCAMAKHGVAVHAWVLMHNHMHLLLTPPRAESLAKAMQSVGRRYARYFNRCYLRSGSLWEGRYKSALVATDDYLISCYRYIELNPVRAGMVQKPEEYPYSSYHANALGKPDKLISTHPLFPATGVGVVYDSGTSDNNVNLGYIELCKEMLDRRTLTNIRRGTEKGLGIGQAEFLLKVANLG